MCRLPRHRQRARARSRYPALLLHAWARPRCTTSPHIGNGVNLISEPFFREQKPKSDPPACDSRAYHHPRCQSPKLLAPQRSTSQYDLRCQLGEMNNPRDLRRVRRPGRLPVPIYLTVGGLLADHTSGEEPALLRLCPTSDGSQILLRDCARIHPALCREVAEFVGCKTTHSG